MKKIALSLLFALTCFTSMVRPVQSTDDYIASKITDWWYTPSMNDSRVKALIGLGFVSATLGGIATYKGAKALFLGLEKNDQTNSHDSTITNLINACGRLVKDAAVRAGGACFSVSGLALMGLGFGFIVAPQEIIREIDKFMAALKNNANR